MSEISEWSSSNPYGDGSSQVEDEEGNDNYQREAGNQEDRKRVEVDVTELDVLNDDVDISLLSAISLHLALKFSSASHMMISHQINLHLDQ
jgi:hypothetical protein